MVEHVYTCLICFLIVYFSSCYEFWFVVLNTNGMAFFQKYKPSYYASDLQGTPQDHQKFHEHISKSPFASPKDHKKQISINAAKNIQTIQNPKINSYLLLQCPLTIMNKLDVHQTQPQAIWIVQPMTINPLNCTASRHCPWMFVLNNLP